MGDVDSPPVDAAADPEPGRIARTPEPPYTAVIFTSLHSGNADGYARMATRMFRLASEQPVRIDDSAFIATSFPSFIPMMRQLGAEFA